MTMDIVAVWPLLERLQRRAQALESEAAALRADVRQVVQALERTVATYNVEGEEYVITAGDVLAVRERLVKPHSEDAIHIVALADKVAQRQSQWPAEEQKRHFWETVEAIRAQAIADGTAIDDPLEAVIGD